MRRSRLTSHRSIVNPADPYMTGLGYFNSLRELGGARRVLEEEVRNTLESCGHAPASGRGISVWSGPEVPGLHACDTRRVFEELLSSARRSVWACSYAFFDGPRAFESLAKHMDQRPDVQVRLLLNIQRKWGDKTEADRLVPKFADRFWTKDWPGTARPSVFYDPRALELDGPGGVLHAKAIVVDDEVAFVTSANLTEAAWDRNIELGLLVRDAALAKSIAVLRTLIEQGLLRPLLTS